MTDPFTFDNCPECGGQLHYPVKGEVECGGCETLFFHEIRGNTHRLWSRTEKHGLKSVVEKTEVKS